MISPPFARSDEWHFRSNFEDKRRASLEASPTFGEIVESILSDVLPGKPIKVAANDDRLPNCWRVKFPFKVSSLTFDRFFNGPSGIRAQFLADSNLGRWANAHLVTMLGPTVVRELERDPLQQFSGPVLSSATDSIAGLSARVWINELSVGWNSRDLAITRWEMAADEPGADSRGLCAPTGSQLVLLGAWINSDGVEMTLPEKIRRHEEISRRGYS
ncbi:hypothetical protein MPL1032_60024 [Mesorhizobium plurifarium]|uniref:Uncharacterized protein n=1 Tax=Mesorhizobium plurifarium TaxID=69974 RepID=A0A0K2W6K9_MESPL|nr:hypothetical protein MPL1032_60024 [Mesorhizobium plurifarium]